MKRRALLASTTAVAALSGCLSSDESGETQLNGLVIQTHTRDRTSIDLRLEWEGDVVLDSTYDVEPDDEEDEAIRFYDGPVPERSWPDEPGQFTLSARIAGEDEWETLEPADYDYPECMDVDVRISEEQSIAFLPITEEWVCDEESPND